MPATCETPFLGVMRHNARKLRVHNLHLGCTHKGIEKCSSLIRGFTYCRLLVS